MRQREVKRHTRRSSDEHFAHENGKSRDYFQSADAEDVARDLEEGVLGSGAKGGAVDRCLDVGILGKVA